MSFLKDTHGGVSYWVGDFWVVVAQRILNAQKKRVTVYFGEGMGSHCFNAVVDDFGSLVEV